MNFDTQAAQGDLLITRIDHLPETAVQAEIEGRDFTVAHSETGHNHVMATRNCDFFNAANDPFVLFVVVKKETELRHLRSFDTHKTITVDKGIYRINRQREYTPEGFRRAAD
ncbi:MAG: hypothetical protein ABW134_11945 [Candidatus Thiodiazotropha endolucinida]